MSEATFSAPATVESNTPSAQPQSSVEATSAAKAPEPTATSEGPSAPAETTTVPDANNAEPSQAPEFKNAPLLTEKAADASHKPTSPAEEPQSALTKKFTDAEWKALSEFRVSLCGFYLLVSYFLTLLYSESTPRHLC